MLGSHADEAINVKEFLTPKPIEACLELAVILVAPLIWVFGEIVPKSVFQQRADTVTPYVIYILRFFSIVFWPILIFFVTLSKLLSRLPFAAMSS